MNEERMRELLAEEYDKAGIDHAAASLRAGREFLDSDIAIAAMRRVEAETVEMCAEIAEMHASSSGDTDYDGGYNLAAGMIADEIRATANKDGGE